MQARAGAVDELLASGALPDVTGTTDSLQLELDKASQQGQVELELARLRGEIGGAPPAAPLGAPGPAGAIGAAPAAGSPAAQAGVAGGAPATAPPPAPVAPPAGAAPAAAPAVQDAGPADAGPATPAPAAADEPLAADEPPADGELVENAPGGPAGEDLFRLDGGGASS